MKIERYVNGRPVNGMKEPASVLKVTTDGGHEFHLEDSGGALLIRPDSCTHTLTLRAHNGGYDGDLPAFLLEASE